MKKFLYFTFLLFGICFAEAEGFINKIGYIHILKKYSDTGVNIFLDETFQEEGAVKYKTYNPFFKKESSGILKQGQTLFCSYGTSLCLWRDYGNGKRSRADYHKIEKKTSSQENKFYDEHTYPDFINEYGEYETEPFRISDWHFLEFNFEDGVYFFISDSRNPISIKQINSKYTEPICLPRIKDCFVYWKHSDSKNGGVQKIELPAKPSVKSNFKKIKKSSLSSYDYSPEKILEISFTDKRYEYHYEVSEIEEPPEPSIYSLKFKNAKTEIELSENSEYVLKIKIAAFNKGIFHGNYSLSFLIDTLPPPPPDIVLSPDEEYSDRPVSVSCISSQENKITVKITPPFYFEKDGKFILSGKSGIPTNYVIEAYACDKEGNISEVSRKNIRVNKLSVFVDSAASEEAEKTYGNSAIRFKTAQAAFIYLNNYFKNSIEDKEPVTVFFKGSLNIGEPVLFTCPVKLKGANIDDGEIANEKAVIKLGNNAGFIAEKTFLQIENCILKRTCSGSESPEVPIIYSANSNIKLNGVEIFAEEGGGIFKFNNSHADINCVSVTSNQTKHCSIIAMENSSGVFCASVFTGKGNSAAAFSLSGSSVKIDEVFCSLEVLSAARAVEAWNSGVELSAFSCTRLPENNYNKDCAVWFDGKSSLVTKDTPLIRGFSIHIKRGK